MGRLLASASATVRRGSCAVARSEVGSSMHFLRRRVGGSGGGALILPVLLTGGSQVAGWYWVDVKIREVIQAAQRG